MNTDKHGWNKTENENLICVYRCSSVAPMAGMKKCRDDSRHSRQDCPRHGGFDVLTALLASKAQQRFRLPSADGHPAMGLDEHFNARDKVEEEGHASQVDAGL